MNKAFFSGLKKGIESSISWQEGGLGLYLSVNIFYYFIVQLMVDSKVNSGGGIVP